jgi:hypothetical protein
VHDSLSSQQIDQLRAFGTCVISDAIESFGVRTQTQGLATAGFQCLFERFAPMVGYAVRFKIRSCDSPGLRGRADERIDWWKHVMSIPAPRVVVIQDTDELPGTGVFLGRVPPTF